jgi:hypothetical protein
MYGDFRAVAGVDLDISQGELVVLPDRRDAARPPRCRAHCWQIRLGGRNITGQPPWAQYGPRVPELRPLSALE